ncbi:MAG: aspartate aminotransferase family protein [Gammaproteobacteria bacterium]
MNHALMQTYARQDISFESGAGAWLTATGGERYLDALSGISVCNLGHANPAVHKAISAQSQKLLHTSNLYRIPLQEQLAEELTRLTGMSAVFFANSGAEANEAAIKICRKRAATEGLTAPLIVTMQGGFHGRTLATLTASGNDKIKTGFAPLLPGFAHVPYNDAEALQALLADNDQVTAVMLEAIQGEGGVVVPDAGYLSAVRRLCDDHNCLLVLDEIQTGLCRTGDWLACHDEQVQPDIVTLAKSLGNGMPIGACLVDQKLREVLQAGDHGSTFGGNPLAASAALAVLHTLQAQQLPERVRQLGERMLAGFRQRLAGHAVVQDIRGRGLMLGIELNQPCGELVEQALAQHLLINVTADKVIRLLPPFIITDEEADSIVDIVSGLIESLN